MIEQIQEYLESVKDNTEEFDKVKGAVGSYFQEAITTDRIKTLAESDKDIKSFFDSEKDKHHSKALETWKTNNLQKIVNDELLKRNPAKDEKDLRIEEIEQKLAAAERSQFEKDMLLKLKDEAITRELPVSLVNHLLSDTEEKTIENLTAFESTWKSELEKVTAGVYRNNGYNPANNQSKKSFSMEEIKNMSEEEINKNWDLIQGSIK